MDARRTRNDAAIETSLQTPTLRVCAWTHRDMLDLHHVYHNHRFAETAINKTVAQRPSVMPGSSLCAAEVSYPRIKSDRRRYRGQLLVVNTQTLGVSDCPTLGHSNSQCLGHRRLGRSGKGVYFTGGRAGVSRPLVLTSQMSGKGKICICHICHATLA